MDTSVDMHVKEDLLKNTFQILNISNGSPGGVKWWRAYPSTKNASKFQKLFCFPFPQEMYDQEYLDNQEASQLVQTMQQK